MMHSRWGSIAGLAALMAAVLVPVAEAQQVPAPAILTDLPDLVVGKADAPVTIEEFASLTCGHCAAFHTNVLPKLKAKYIDTGQVKLIYRDFPLNELAVGAAMFGRCGGEAKREAIVSALFKTQDTWMGPKAKPVEEMVKLGKQFGLTQADVETCLSNEIQFAAIVAQRDAFDAKHKIEGTPTFVINGKKMDGNSDWQGFDKALAPLVKK